MTICVGAICDGGKKVIVAADRMITAEHLSVQFESEEGKIIQLSDKCVAMTAGDALVRTEIFNDAQSKINSGITTVSQIVETIKEAFVTERKKRFEERVLRPRGITLEDFYGGAQRTLDPSIIMRLDKELEGAELGLEVLMPE
jgi:hypothetical protein